MKNERKYPKTLQAFRASCQRMSVSEAAEDIGECEDRFEGSDAVLVYAGGCYIEEQPAKGGHFLLIYRDSWIGTREQMEAILFFDFYTSEILDNWTHDELTVLLGEWCEWKGIEAHSADEMLHDEMTEASSDRDSETRNRIEWLGWFVDTWNKIERGETQ